MFEQELKLPSGWEAWTVAEEIGYGISGVVYRILNRENGQERAMKVVSVEADNRHAIEDCRNEIRSMMRLRGLSEIVSVEDFAWETAEGQCRFFLRMELLTSLPEYIRENGIDLEGICALGLDISRALTYCEAQGMVHRDIKPENLFVSPRGHFKLGDFGLSVVRDGKAGPPLGTLSYIAPEVYKGEAPDCRSDICSLGLVLYRLLNRNRDPFVSLDRQIISRRERENAFAQRMAGKALPPPADAKEPLASIVLKACACDPADRYRTAEEFHSALLCLVGRKEPEENDRSAGALPGPDSTPHARRTAPGAEENEPEENDRSAATLPGPDSTPHVRRTAPGPEEKEPGRKALGMGRTAALCAAAGIPVCLLFLFLAGDGLKGRLFTEKEGTILRENDAMTEDRREIAEYGNAEEAGSGAAGAGRESSAAITMLRIAADTDKIPYCYEYGEGEKVRYLGSDVKLMDYLADTLSAEYEIVPLDGLKHGSDLMADFDVLISGMSPYDFMNWGSDLVWSDPYSIGEKTVPYAAITMKALEAKYRYREALDGSETGYGCFQSYD